MERSGNIRKKDGKGLHKVFNVFVRKLNNPLPSLGESGSEVSHFIPKSRNFTEVTRLLAEVKNDWIKSTLKEIKNLINNQNFLMDYPMKGYPVTPCMDVYK